LGRNNLLDTGFCHNLFERGAKILKDHHHLCTRIMKLMFQLARRVKRIHIHHGESCAQDTKQHHGILQNIRQHDRHAITDLQLQHAA